MIDGDECISQRCWEWVWESGMGVILLVLCTHIPPPRRADLRLFQSCPLLRSADLRGGKRPGEGIEPRPACYALHLTVVYILLEWL